MEGGFEGFQLNTGASIPAVGLGTWQADGASCQAAVATALQDGYRLVDCAHLYGNEREVGNALRQAFEGGALTREDVFITSKLWCTTRDVQEAAQISLKNLGLAHLDLYLLHSPMTVPLGDATDPPSRLEVIQPMRHIEETWRAMELLVEQGTVKAIGFSNLTISLMQDILSFCKVVPAVYQGELHPLWRQDELVNFCKSKGIHVIAHTPLGIPGNRVELVELVPGYSSGEEDAAKSFASPSNQEANGIPRKRKRSIHAPVLTTTIITEIAQRLNKTAAQIILRWGVQRGTTVLPRSLRPDRIKSNLDVLNWLLPEADWKVVNGFEPQHCQVEGNHSYLHETSSGRLQAVVETEITG